MSTMMSTIPIVLVSGFLGAGKTTLMRRLIQSAHERGLQTCVIVNEFGAADVDGSILKESQNPGEAELLSSVAGGCACCSGQEEFLWTLLEVAERQGPARPDVLLIECSGLADPLLMLDTITLARLLPLVRLGALVAVADGSRLDFVRDEAAPLLMRQLQLADIVVLNKIDLLDNAFEKWMRPLKEVAPFAQILPAKEARIDFELLWPRVLATGAAATSDGSHASSIEASAAAHAHYRTVVCPLPHPVEEAWLRAELELLGPEVWRAKGFVRLRGQSVANLLQMTRGRGGARIELRPFALFEPGSANEPPTSIVFIGPSLDRAALMKSFGSSALLPMV